MTVKLLADRYIDSKNYKAGELCDTDDFTEAGLIAAKLAVADLTGGITHVEPIAQPQYVPVLANINGVTGRMGILMSDFYQCPAIALVGDSIAQQSSQVTPDVRTNDRGILPWVLAYMGQPWSFEPSDTFAEFGSSLTNIINLQLPLLVAASKTRFYKRVFISGGTNDTSTGRPLADIKADYLTIFNTCWSIGAIPSMWGILPRGVDVAMTVAKRKNQLLNEWLYQMAKMGALEFIDAGEAIADNTTAFGNVVATYTYDGVLHPNTKGANLLGRAIADYYIARGVRPGLRFATQQSDQFDSDNNPYGVAFSAANPLLQGGTTSPTGMTTAGGTWSKVARTLPNGQSRSDPSCVLAASATHYLYDDWTTTGEWTATQLQPGDIVEARALLEISNGVSINNINIQIAENNGSGNVMSYGLGTSDSGIVDNVNHVLHLKSPRVAIRDYAGSGNASIYSRVNVFTGVGGSGTAVIKGFEVRKVG